MKWKKGLQASPFFVFEKSFLFYFLKPLVCFLVWEIVEVLVAIYLK